MSGSFDDQGRLVISDGRIITAFGKKRSGKSVLGLMLAKSYPGDVLVVDVAGDDGPSGSAVHVLRGDVEELSRRWPERHRELGPQGQWQRMIVRYVPDPGSKTFAEDVDAVIGIGLAHGKSEEHKGHRGACVLIHEIGVVAPVHRTQPHMRRLLMSNRHSHVTAILCGPRPVDVDPLVLQQSDLVYIFTIMNPNDRRRLAESIGWAPRDIDDAVAELDDHEYLRYDANEGPPRDGAEDMRLTSWPALPEDAVKAALAPVEHQRGTTW